MGTSEEYETARSRSFGVPIVVSGFEPLDLLEGVYRQLVDLLEARQDVELRQRSTPARV